jgi:hypothetical protein
MQVRIASSAWAGFKNIEFNPQNEVIYFEELAAVMEANGIKVENNVWADGETSVVYKFKEAQIPNVPLLILMGTPAKQGGAGLNTIELFAKKLIESVAETTTELKEFKSMFDGLSAKLNTIISDDVTEEAVKAESVVVKNNKTETKAVEEPIAEIREIPKSEKAEVVKQVVETVEKVAKVKKEAIETPKKSSLDSKESNAVKSGRERTPLSDDKAKEIEERILRSLGQK